MPCLLCDDTGWVCEGHEDRPWGGLSKRGDAYECGPGVPCPRCNVPVPGEAPDWSKAGVKTGFDKDGSRH
jgi:hypothetical protein